jgi:uncharacterized iron-regulated membrane protein
MSFELTAVKRSANRALYFVHRWLGIFTCILCLIWFVSGLVMVYVPFPAWTEAERLGALPALDGSKIAVTPDQALAVSGLKADAATLRLEVYGDEPVYRIETRGKALSVSATDGRAIGPVTVDEARVRLAKAFTNTGIEYLGLVDRDQWTVVSRFNPHRPLYLFALQDAAATNVYVSSRTGEIVQNATRSERFWNWLGAVPHWVYVTPIRQYQELWRQSVMWLSGPLIIAAIAGLWIGILRLRVRRPYSNGRVTPYRGWMKWHHVGGLVGGVFLTTWIFSGWLSVNPFGLFARTQITLVQKQAYTGLQPTLGVTLAALKAAAVTPASALQITHISGEPLIVAKDSHGRKSLFDGRTGDARTLEQQNLSEAAMRLFPQAHLVHTQLLTEEDLYWYSHHKQRPLPVLRYVFDDANATWVHVDPATGELLGLSDRSARTYRWVFSFLHDFDLPVLLRNQPARDILIWVLSIAGLVISLSGIVIGWRHLKRKSLQRGRQAARRRAGRKLSSSAA